MKHDGMSDVDLRSLQREINNQRGNDRQVPPLTQRAQKPLDNEVKGRTARSNEVRLVKKFQEDRQLEKP
jgi:hypothetical protein